MVDFIPHGVVKFMLACGVIGDLEMTEILMYPANNEQFFRGSFKFEK